jgi:nicotinate-nucleotide adenylyltransferase
VGTDAYEKLDQWYRIDDLKKLVTLEIIERPGFSSPDARTIDAIDVSATQVRLHQTEQVPPSVAAYIKEHNLYVS